MNNDVTYNQSKVDELLAMVIKTNKTIDELEDLVVMINRKDFEIHSLTELETFREELLAKVNTWQIQLMRWSRAGSDGGGGSGGRGGVDCGARGDDG